MAPERTREGSGRAGRSGHRALGVAVLVPRWRVGGRVGQEARHDLVEVRAERLVAETELGLGLASSGGFVERVRVHGGHVQPDTQGHELDRLPRPSIEQLPAAAFRPPVHLDARLVL